MKVIYPEKQSSVSAATQDSNFPGSNMLDNYPKKVWKATGYNSAVTIITKPGANAIGFAGTNAVSIALTVKNSGGTGVIESKVSYDLKGIDNYYKLITDTYISFPSFWIDYTYRETTHYLVVEFESIGSSVSVHNGVIRAGIARTFYEPDYSLQEGMNDYSIIKELNNGAYYIRKRDIVKTFTGTVELYRDGDFYVFMRDIILQNGPNPLMWRITDYDSNNWTVFGRVDKMPTGAHKLKDYSEINFSIVEVL
jgi:hypothetical protein